MTTHRTDRKKNQYNGNNYKKKIIITNEHEKKEI